MAKRKKTGIKTTEEGKPDELSTRAGPKKSERHRAVEHIVTDKEMGKVVITGEVNCAIPPRGCGRRKGVGEFADLQKSDLCINCEERIKRAEEAKLKQAYAAKKAAELADAVARDDNAVSPHIDNMISRMMTEFGGMDEFCHQWRIHMGYLMKERKGSPTVIKNFFDLAKLVAMATAKRDRADEVKSLTDDELSKEIASIVFERNNASQPQRSSNEQNGSAD